VIDHLGTAWGTIEPQKALAWLETLPADETRTEATRGALNSWAATDTPGLVTWIAKQPPGANADLARESLGSVYADSDPAEAMKVGMGITDVARKSDALVRYYRQWLKQDDRAAQQWLQANRSLLPPEVQQRMTK
jgi:hypothetical protein